MIEIKPFVTSFTIPVITNNNSSSDHSFNSAGQNYFGNRKNKSFYMVQNSHERNSERVFLVTSAYLIILIFMAALGTIMVKATITLQNKDIIPDCKPT